jgi:hypothetical protein
MSTLMCAIRFGLPYPPSIPPRFAGFPPHESGIEAKRSVGELCRAQVLQGDLSGCAVTTRKPIPD